MKRTMLCGLYLAIALFFGGCSHHITSYSKGGGVEFSWTPDSFTPSVRAGFYEFLLSMNRENAHTRYTTNLGMGLGHDIFGIASFYAMITGKEPVSSTGTGTVLEVRTGPMVNGYVDKILKTPDLNANHATIIKSLASVDTHLSDRETRVTPFKAEANTTPVVKTTKGLLNTEISTPTNEHTEEAIKEQVKSKGWIDVVYGWVLWAGIGVIVLIIGIILYITWRVHVGKKDVKSVISEVKDIAGAVKDTVKTVASSDNKEETKTD